MVNSPAGLEPVALECTFVRLEPMTLDHHTALSEIGLDPEIWRLTVAVISTPEEMRSYMESALELQRQGTSLPFVTIERSSGRAVGSTRFGNYDAANRALKSAGPGSRDPGSEPRSTRRRNTSCSATHLRDSAA